MLVLLCFFSARFPFLCGRSAGSSSSAYLTIQIRSLFGNIYMKHNKKKIHIAPFLHGCRWSYYKCHYCVCFPHRVFFVCLFFSPCIAGFIGSIRRHDPSLTKPGPSLISLHRYNLPVGKRGGPCAIEVAVDDGPARRLQEYVSHPASAVMQPACNQLNALSGNCAKLASQSTACAASPFP